MVEIHKYQLSVLDLQEIKMPKGAKILDIQVQEGVPCIWAMHPIPVVYERRRFIISGTGQKMNAEMDQLVFIGTFQIAGNLVFHVFETEVI